MAMSTWRADTLESYEREKFPEDISIENALLCEKYSDELLPASWDDAIFWLKKSLDIRETLYGKDSLQNISLYERMAYIYADKPSYNNALKWYRKALRIREKAVGKSDLSLVEDYVCIAQIYRDRKDYEEYAKNIFHAKHIEEDNRPTENPVSFYVYQELADYYSKRRWAGYKEGEALPQQTEEDISLQKEALQNMVASAQKEYGAESCEAVACLEKYIHDIKLPVQERLEIAGKILKIYYANIDTFERYKKSYCPLNDFINHTTSRIAADIWFSWSTDFWFPWTIGKKRNLDRSSIGWGIKWIKDNISEEIAEKLIMRFNPADQKMIREIISQEQMKEPVN
ncbi:MAG: tetratricopeptide repeat protein [Lachnospiraceae bacterium]|nr:tetratricopeptide repeat protein [Lachnospiraceae bacterium]